MLNGCACACSGKKAGLAGIGGLGSLGDICTDSMCTEGRAAVAGMWDLFNNLSSSHSEFNATSFQPACQAIQGELDAALSSWSDYIPFNPACCTARDIGHKATALSAQMAQSVGVAAPPVPAAGTDWGSLVFWGALAAVAVVYSPQIKSVFK